MILSAWLSNQIISAKLMNLRLKSIQNSFHFGKVFETSIVQHFGKKFSVLLMSFHMLWQYPSFFSTAKETILTEILKPLKNFLQSNKKNFLSASLTGWPTISMSVLKLQLALFLSISPWNKITPLFSKEKVSFHLFDH